jgi:CheY-like chemotaxis protein
MSEKVVAWAADLVFGARIRAAAEAAGRPLRLVRGGEELWQVVRDEAPGLVVVDLDARGDPVAAITRLKSEAATQTLPLVAYASHVREDVLRAARAAGADRVLARGVFARSIAAILSTAGPGSGPHGPGPLAGDATGDA